MSTQAPTAKACATATDESHGQLGCVKEPALVFSLLLLSLAVLAVIAGCQTAPKSESRPMPTARTTPPPLEPSQSNSTPAIDNCGLTAYPVSRSTQEILAAVPRSAARPDSMMLAKVAIDAEGRVTHLRVLRLAWPEAPNSAAINAQAVDSIKRGHYAPTSVGGKPMAVCSDVGVIIDLRLDPTPD
jgi:hypothetical protein